MAGHSFALEIFVVICHTKFPDGEEPPRETDAFDTLIYPRHHRRPAGLPTERLAVHVRGRFLATDGQLRTRISKPGITGGRAR